MLWPAFAALTLAAAAAAQDLRGEQSFRTLAPLFAYDSTLPLRARTLERFDTANFTRQKLVIDGWRGSRVPGLIAVPKNSTTRHPVIVLIDGIGGWKERWWQATSWNRGRVLIDSLMAAGFAVAMLDAPASGERTFENDFENAESFVKRPAQWRDMGLQNTIEQRRLLDYLATRADIDTTRIGVLGLSHGGMVTFILAALEPRVRVAVAGLTPMQSIPDALLPENYASRVHVPLLMLAGSKDTWYTRDQTERVLAMVGSKDKQLVWYDVGHRLPEEYAGAATTWFRRHLR
ncbi:MAG: dienelactone hydrolase family protein [bacterium]